MRLIVSLTSTSSRLAILKYTLISILSQSRKPDLITLCLSKTPFLSDKGVKDVPSWLAEMTITECVEVYWVDNTGPYRKLLPTYLMANNDDWIVTCDDDVIYAPNWLDSLVKVGLAYPDSIVCGGARKPALNFMNKLQSYVNWPLVNSDIEELDLLPIGVFGVLYRKGLLDERVMHSTKYQELSPKQDDLWFNLARVSQGTKVVTSIEAKRQVFPIQTLDGLSETNVGVNEHSGFLKKFIRKLSYKLLGYLGFAICENDIAIKKLRNYQRSLKSEV